MYQIYSHYFTAGFEIEDGQVVSADPIIKYLIGKTLEEVKIYCERRDWGMLEVHKQL